MIKSITVTNYLGDSIKLVLARPELSGFVVKHIEGLGPTKATINTSEMSTSDGSIFNSARAGQRNIVLDLVFQDSPEHGSIEDLRHKSYKYFPLKKKVKLLIETDRRISETEGYVESNEPTIFSKQEGTSISIICPNSYLYSAGQNDVTVFSGVEPTFEFPFGNESLTDNLLEMAAIHHRFEQVVPYSGDAEVGVTITINAIGEASNISIYNTGTRETMRIDTTKLAALTGSGIIARDEIVICTVSGQKSITLLRNGVKTNILNCLSRESDWFRLSKGDNVFAYMAETGGSNLQFRIENRVVYEGV